MKIYTWDDMAEEQLNPLAGRKALHGTAITVAHFRFDKGSKVAIHDHANDQVTIVEKGAVRMVVGGEEFVLRAGQMVHVPPDVPHGNEALEDTVILELFSPIREDWIRGDDSYLRQK
jgi:quercetin dioxygenase-like cupin family protein